MEESWGKGGQMGRKRAEFDKIMEKNLKMERTEIRDKERKRTIKSDLSLVVSRWDMEPGPSVSL